MCLVNMKTNECFICTQKRREFGKLGIRFNFHKMYEHNLWSYVYYIIMIEDKIKTNKNLNKVEKYVFNLYKKKVYSWLPLNRSITLGFNLRKFNVI